MWNLPHSGLKLTHSCCQVSTILDGTARCTALSHAKNIGSPNSTAAKSYLSVNSLTMQFSSVQFSLTSACGQVQPLDVARVEGHSVKGVAT
jgi:hypothetical protein